MKLVTESTKVGSIEKHIKRKQIKDKYKWDAICAAS